MADGESPPTVGGVLRCPVLLEEKTETEKLSGAEESIKALFYFFFPPNSGLRLLVPVWMRRLAAQAFGRSGAGLPSPQLPLHRMELNVPGRQFTGNAHLPLHQPSSHQGQAGDGTGDGGIAWGAATEAL